MRVIAWKTLRDFADEHPQALVPLRVWCRLVESGMFAGPADVRRVFGTRVDFLPDDVVVFDVGGNKYRISANIRYRLDRLFIRAVMTHEEYERRTARGSL